MHASAISQTMVPQALDFLAESDELAAVLEPLGEAPVSSKIPKERGRQ